MVVSTVFNIMFDVLKQDEKASFFFIGAEDEKDVAGKATRRFRFYSDFTLSVVSDRIFRHYRNDHLSLFILVNKNHVEDMDTYKNRITDHVIKAMIG